MPRPRDELTAGEWAVLALLDEQPAHGFALAQTMATNGAVGRVWSMRRPLVYRALEALQERGLARPIATLPGNAAPQRTIVESTQAGSNAVRTWLNEPIHHIRDARSLLMLKLLFLTRRDADVTPLLGAQRVRFEGQAKGLTDAAAIAAGFDRGLLLWRLHATTAVISFIDAILSDPLVLRP